MFNKSKSKPVQKIETVNPQVTETAQDRNSILSGWGVPAESFTSKDFAQEHSAVTGSTKKGYKICAKCLAVVPATDFKCPSCGFIKK